MKRVFASSVLLLVAATTLLSAKGVTTRIRIEGADLTTPIEITDPELLGNFNVWAGRGTYVSYSPGDVRHEGTEGFIIDWPAGTVAERPAGVRGYRVSFFVKYRDDPNEQLAYVVFYDWDPTTERGYVYLPGKHDEWYRRNTRAIFRGVEGNWFHETTAWQDAVNPFITRAR